MLKVQKNILIYPYREFCIVDGGGVALYQLANVLDKAGLNVRMNGHHKKLDNPLFTKFYNNNFPIKDAVVVYTETTVGNPLKAKRVVRWIMSEIGKIAKRSIVDTWGKDDLVYFFNSQSNLLNKDFYKPLTTFYIDFKYKDLGRQRSGTCYAMRKGNPNFMNRGPYFPPSKSMNIPIKSNWFEIDRKFEDYLNKFNDCEFFISYDPLTFTSFIAALCGCISIVNPCENMDKKTWLQNTALWPYLSNKCLDNISGIAYGMDDVQHAINTLPFLHEQMLDFCEYCKLGIQVFIKDIRSFYNQPNTVKRVFY